MAAGIKEPLGILLRPQGLDGRTGPVDATRKSTKEYSARPICKSSVVRPAAGRRVWGTPLYEMDGCTLETSLASRTRHSSRTIRSCEDVRASVGLVDQ